MDSSNEFPCFSAHVRSHVLLIGLLLTIFALPVSTAYAQWTATSAISPYTNSAYSFAVVGSNLLVGTFGNGVFRSTNDGTDWTQVNTGLGVGGYSRLYVYGPDIYAGLTGYLGAYRTMNSGTSWTRAGLYQFNTYAFTTHNSYIFAGTMYGVKRATIGDTTWTYYNHTSMQNNDANCFAWLGTTMYVGALNGVFSTTDDGVTWNRLITGMSANMNIGSMTVCGTNLYAGINNGNGGIYRSTNGGANWTALNTGLTNQNVYALITVGTNVFAGTYGGGVFMIPDNGTSWTAVNTGLGNNYVLSFTVKGTNLFAGTASGVFKRSVADFTSVSENHISEIPNRFALDQNYPNPFNSSTTISFSLPKSSEVTLSVFDITGRNVATLANGHRSAGQYSVLFDASGLPSGVYMYQLNAGSLSQTKKLEYVK